jgi:hypothetical protein
MENVYVFAFPFVAAVIMAIVIIKNPPVKQA